VSTPIAVCASGDDVSASVTPALRSRHQVLGRALELASLAESQAVLSRERGSVGAPHRLIAVIATGLLRDTGRAPK
jgi:hypothetical protein